MKLLIETGLKTSSAVVIVPLMEGYLDVHIIYFFACSLHSSVYTQS